MRCLRGLYADGAQVQRIQEEIMTADTHAGSCFCGAVEFEAIGAPREMGYCHCESCRAYSGGPLNAFALWQTHNVRITKGAEHVGSFNRTGMSDRQFCRKCGGHLITRHPGLGLTDVKAGAESANGAIAESAAERRRARHRRSQDLPPRRSAWPRPLRSRPLAGGKRRCRTRSCPLQGSCP